VAKKKVEKQFTGMKGMQDPCGPKGITAKPGYMLFEVKPKSWFDATTQKR